MSHLAMKEIDWESAEDRFNRIGKDNTYFKPYWKDEEFEFRLCVTDNKCPFRERTIAIMKRKS